jgi:hypothetical protein
MLMYGLKFCLALDNFVHNKAFLHVFINISGVVWEVKYTIPC